MYADPRTSVKSTAHLNPEEVSASAKAPDADMPSRVRALKEHMGEGEYHVLVSIYNWAMLWQDLHVAAVDENTPGVRLNEPRLAALMTPLTGFGNFATWAIHSHALLPLLTREILQWMNDEAYRKTAPFTEHVLMSIAPALASSSRGWPGARDVIDVLKQKG